MMRLMATSALLLLTTLALGCASTREEAPLRSGLGTAQAAAGSARSGAGPVMSPAQMLKWIRNENGAQFAFVWGDAASGPHGEFVRFPAGFTTPLHMHSSDYHGVVIGGTLMNPMDDNSTGPELPAGSYYSVPGGRRHLTRCVSTVDCVFYIHQQAKFDFIPVR